MLIIRVHLLSAITGQRTELARMHICNTGGHTNPRLGNYDGTTFLGRDDKALDPLSPRRSGRIENWPRMRNHVWGLVTTMLCQMGYGTARATEAAIEPPKSPEAARELELTKIVDDAISVARMMSRRRVEIDARKLALLGASQELIDRLRGKVAAQDAVDADEFNCAGPAS